MPLYCCLVFCVLVLLNNGCARTPKPTMPPLHPVTGVVCVETIPVAGGSLHVVPQWKNSVGVVTADIGPDGRFELATLDTHDGAATRRPGAPEGTYKIKFVPASPDEEIETTELTQVFKVEPGAANEWKIELAEKQ